MTFQEWWDFANSAGTGNRYKEACKSAYMTGFEAARKQAENIADTAIYEQNVDTSYGSGKANAYADMSYFISQMEMIE